jgi:Alcohol dehydrogenase GroES-like domain
MGLLEGWWLGEADGREEQPYTDVERWNHELQSSGFGGVEIAAHDHEQPYQINVCLIARPAVSPKSSKLVTLLSNEFGSIWKATAEVFKDRGYQVQSCRLDEHIPSSDAVVSILDLEEPFFYNMSPYRLNSVQEGLQQCQSTNIIWATNASQIECEDPHYAMAIGAIRTIRGEMALPITTVELENTCVQALQSLVEVLELQKRHFPTSDATSSLDPDFEFSFSKGLVMIPRIVPVSISNELLDDRLVEQKCNERIELQAGNGSLDTISWVATQPKNFGELDVEVDVKYVGLNFKDMLLAMFVVRDAKSEMGLEGAGIVSNIGSKVTRVKPGDRVMFYAGGAFTNRCVMLEDLCIKIPETLTFENAATMPCVFATTIHSLLDLGGLRKGQVGRQPCVSI